MISKCFFCGHQIRVKQNGLAICTPCYQQAQMLPPAERFRLFIEYTKAERQASFLAAAKHCLWELSDAAKTVAEEVQRLREKEEED